ncbi:uracil nucleotide/cysteinyl leukotriene receptor [Ctenopharyngodon idella]|uniref:uracil nucleotide/cysteinyl leukotriene receptor n=1 Tax=Ctenopharyngodon idella TaxID=7959 RepID=UPI00223124AF|nr:uracil nucleotide/cysteinyl leukotriene receptor [Ctenopharyngodon idella]
MSCQSHNQLHTAAEDHLQTTETYESGWSEPMERTMAITELFRYINSSLLISHRPLNASPAEQTVYGGCAHMPAVLIFYLVLQFINMFLGIPANIMVLWLIHKNKGDSSTSDIFIVHLAVLDTFFCLIPPLELANIVYLTTSSTWYVLRFFYGVKDSSPLFLSCICLDRYMAVCHPITFTELKDKRHRSVCAGVVWFITLVYAAAKCVGNIPNFEKVFTVMILAAFAFMLFCNISILWALRQSAPGRDERHPVKKKAFKMVVIILAIIVINYFPPVALFPFQEYFSPAVFRCYIHYIAFGFMDISSSIQPVLYLSREKLPKVPLCCSKNTECADDPVFTINQ